MDVRTLYLANSAACAVSVVAMLLVWLTNRTVPGVRSWAAGTVSIALAWPLFLLQGKLDSRFATFVLPTLMVIFTVVAFHDGARRFTGKPASRGHLLLAVVPVLVAYLYFFMIDENLAWRVRVTTLWAGGFVAMTARTLLMERRRGLLLGTRLMAAGFILVGLLMCYRLFAWGREAPPPDWVSGQGFSSVSLAFVSIILTYLWMFILLVTINQYQTREAALRMQSQRMAEQGLLEARAEIERQKAAHLRQMMARELHDGIGGITATVAMLAANSKESGSPAKEEVLGLIEEMAMEGNRSIRGLLGVLDSDSSGWREIFADLERYARNLSSSSGIHLDWRLGCHQAEDLMLDSATAHSLRKVVMEALHNIVRHSGARNAGVCMEVSDGQLRVEVRDDGKGVTDRRPDGRGLTNMRLRMEEMGGTLTIESGNGTIIRMAVPSTALSNA